MRAKLSWVPLLPCWLAAGLATAPAAPVAPAVPTAPSVPAAALISWSQHRAAVLAEPGLVRYYGFEGIQEGAPVPNLAGPTGELHLQGQPLHITSGRWQDKAAISLDAGCLAGNSFPVPNRAFSVEMWVRTHGPGIQKGNPGVLNGALMAVGTGYWDGWRLTTWYPDAQLHFEIGRPKPSSSFSVAGGAVTDEAWHLVAATWDGTEMRTFVDGFPTGVSSYTGAYTPPNNDGQLKIGFADSGVGSVKMDVDEIAIYDRARDPREILADAFPRIVMPAGLVTRILAADAMPTDHPADAVAAWQQILKAPDLPASLVGPLRLRLAAHEAGAYDWPAASTQVSLALAQPDLDKTTRLLAMAQMLVILRSAPDCATADVCQQLVESPDLSPADHLTALKALALSRIATGSPALAARALQRALRIDGLSAHDRLDLQFRLAHNYDAARDFDSARSTYATILNAPDSTAPARAEAQMMIGLSYQQQKSTTAAEQAYSKVEAMADAPASDIWEARERGRELDRAVHGLPAIDPAWFRMMIPTDPTPAAEFWVAPDGSDAASGALQKPFATLARARDAARAARIAGVKAGSIVIHVLPGEYRTDSTLTLGPEDSGTSTSPLIIRGSAAHRPVLSGGISVTGWKPVTDPAVLQRLPELARGKVMQVDLKALGITNFPPVGPRGYGIPAIPAMELFCNGEPMTIARWPNHGFVATGKILDAGGAKGGATFEFDDPRMSRWAHASDAYVYGYWKWRWADASLAVKAFDPTVHIIRTDKSSPTGMESGMPFYIFNLLEELDSPGEYYIDRHTGILYFYPPADLATADTQVSVLATPFVQAQGSAYIRFENISFTCSQLDGMSLTDCSHCLISGCRISDLGGAGALIDGGQDDGLFNCQLEKLGRGGALLRGGDRKTLTPGHQFIEDCLVRNFSRIDRTYTPAVQLWGVGNRVAHNHFTESPGHAMRVEGNDHLIEFNEVDHVVQESDDQGGVDMWGNPSYRGNIIRCNYWHDIGSGIGPVGQAGVRLDDAISGVQVYGNIFQRCSEGFFGGLQINGGKDNVVQNNLFLECRYGISVSRWSQARWDEFLASPTVVNLLTKEVDIHAPPYSVRYPDLAHLAESPSVNHVWDNVFCQCGSVFHNDGGIQDTLDNLAIGGAPGFADMDHNNLSLKPDAPVFASTGFWPIPFSEIGRYKP